MGWSQRAVVKSTQPSTHFQRTSCVCLASLGAKADELSTFCGQSAFAGVEPRSTGTLYRSEISS